MFQTEVIPVVGLDAKGSRVKWKADPNISTITKQTRAHVSLA
jgi:hypothetical protein